jgi:hypothetical protein
MMLFPHPPPPYPKRPLQHPEPSPLALYQIEIVLGELPEGKFEHDPVIEFVELALERYAPF